MDLNTALGLIARQSNTIDQLLNDLKVERERNTRLQDMLSPPVHDYQRTDPKGSEQSRTHQNIELGG